MSEAVETTAPLELRPGLLRGFLGIWIFEWQSRLTWGKLWMAACFVITVPALMLATLPEGRSGPFLSWILNFHLLLLVPIYSLSFFGPLIRDELQADTLGFIITRPLKRHTIFIFKYVCVMLWTQMLALLSGGLFIAVAWHKGISAFTDIFPTFLLSQALAVLAYGALAGLLGLLSKKYMVLGVVYGFIIEWGIGSIPTNIHSLAVSHHLKTILANNERIADHFGWLAGSIPEAAGMAAIATVVFLTAAALIFNFREYHHVEEMQK